MKFNIKKLYKSTIKTLEAHQIELTLALAALSVVAFVPETPEETEQHDRIKNILEGLSAATETQLAVLRRLESEAEEVI
jgi:hypothetical protein